MHKDKSYLISAIFILFAFIGNQSYAQNTVTQDIQSRTSASVLIKANKKLRFKFTPEIRMDKQFNIDKWFLEGEGRYKPYSFLAFELQYRFVVNPRTTKETELLNRFALSTKLMHQHKRFDFSFRTAFTNYNDDLSIDKYLRYKFKLEYNIKKLPLNPYIAAEAFHQISYNQMDKMRYAFGLQYKISKHHALDMAYKLDYHLLEYYNKHIISFAYTYKL
jgi:hypothetical protein